jgi:single-stranded-DNA-specific exonuclease
LSDLASIVGAYGVAAARGGPPLPLPLSCASIRHLMAVRSLAPFGVGNPEPVFLFENITIDSVKKFGKAKEHLECAISDGTAHSNSSGQAIAFTFFANDDCIEKTALGKTVSILGTLEAGWRGGVRIHIKEIL